MERGNLVETVMQLRKGWTRQDYVDAYEDEWDEIPDSIDECRERMESYLYHTYDKSLLEEIIENGGE